jgi:DNA repair protein RecN (Recombination protein N)
MVIFLGYWLLLGNVIIIFKIPEGKFLLSELRIKNLGIIEDVAWHLDAGLNVITGETGAGKSLMIDAIELLLSGKAGEEVIWYGSNEALIEGIFCIPQNNSTGSLRAILSQKDLNTEEDTLIISAQFRRKGTNLVRVNGQTVTRSYLHQIGRLLIDFHSQSEHYMLMDPSTHLDFLDRYAGTQSLRIEFSERVEKLHQMEQELSSLESNRKEIAARQDFLHFQLDEIDRVKLREGEDVELENERNILSSIEKLKELSFNAYTLLNGDEACSALDTLNRTAADFRKLTELDPTLKDQYKYFEETLNGLTQVAWDIHSYSQKLQDDPDRLHEVEARLDLIKGLKRKYGSTILEVLNYRKNIKEQLDVHENLDERLVLLHKMINIQKAEMGQMAERLSGQRTEAALELEKTVKHELNELNMDQVEFKVSSKRSHDSNGIPFMDGVFYSFVNSGADAVEFLASTNPGEPVRPLAAIASTGELSRFTLALKSALAAVDNVPVLIFDEIDIGIGGRSGEVIGKKLWLLGKSHQVICVTHLPQIAAFADTHFGVRKTTYGKRTVSTMEKFSDDTRLNEIAVMLAGPQYTKISLKSASELLRNAEKWKRAAG